MKMTLYVARHPNYDGKGGHHYAGSGYTIGDESLKSAVFKPSPVGWQRSNEVKLWGFEIVPIEVEFTVPIIPT